jgi:hypothetical protein
VITNRWSAIGAWLLGAASVPRFVCGIGAGDLFEGALPAQDALAREVSARVRRASDPLVYKTGYERFDAQSSIAIYQMTILGLGQIVLDHPETRAQYLPTMREAARRLTNPRLYRYLRGIYADNGLGDVPLGEGHAYLGYVNLALSMLRSVDPQLSPRLVQLNDRLSLAFAARLRTAPTGLIETYPHETWPPDVAAVAGSVGLYARAVKRPVRELLGDWGARFAKCSIDAASGFLVQRVESGRCTPRDAPRGSGTAVASYFTSFVDPALSGKLHAALAEHGTARLLGFSALREYAPGHTGSGDNNSGPVIFGVSVGATGFGLASARLHRDRELFEGLYRTAQLFGMPFDTAEGRGFAAGGALGNALLLAMLTARSP